MTPEARIDKLEQRVDRIESDIWSRLDQIENNLTSLIVKNAENKCPAPGMCVALQDRVIRLENTYDTLTKTVADLIRWRAWLTGINLVISTISLAALSVIGAYIVKHL